MPRCESAATFSFTCARTCAARDFPSSSRAAMGAGSLTPYLSPPAPRIKLAAPSRSKTNRNPNPMAAVPQFPAANDPDALETQEWLDPPETVPQGQGPEARPYLAV